MSRETSHGRATVVQLCAAFSLSRQAFYAARPHAATDTLDHVREPGSRKRSATSRSGSGGSAPRRAPRRTDPNWVSSDDLLAAIREIVRDNVGWGVRKVWAVLRRGGIRVGLKRVWALMKANGLTLEPVALRETPGRYGHVAVPESNRRWGTDLTTVWTRQDGVVAVVPTLDYGDRFALALTVSKSQESQDVLAGVESALTEYFRNPSSVPDGFELRTDHGPQYTGSDADSLCTRWKTDHTFAPVGRPTGNAVAERFIQTMKIEVIWTQDWESADQLRDALKAWLVKYNHERPHQSLGWLTPAEKRALNLGRSRVAAA